VSAGRRLALFALALVALFGVGALAGRVLAPSSSEAGSESHGAHAEMEMAADPVRGLAVAEHGLRLVVERPELTRGAERELRFRIVAADGEAVRSFDLEHSRRLHLIVVRRDLSGFQHLHPRMRPDGTWAVPLTLSAAGSYRLFADFSHAGEPTTLAGDLRVDGGANLRELPAPSRTARGDGGLEVRLREAPAGAGEEASLDFEVARDGRPVALDDYLGAGGHLVALRAGDLAFLHVHPEDAPAAAARGAVGFRATFPSAGRYRLFLQFKVDGRVHTVAFTREVG
jgi:hypothetical protein